MKPLIDTKLMEMLVRRVSHTNMENSALNLKICDRETIPGNPDYGIPDQVKLVERKTVLMGYISNSPAKIQLENQDSKIDGECTMVVLAHSLKWDSITPRTRVIYQGKIYKLQLQPVVGIELGKELLYQFRLIPDIPGR